jgi:hypothetical protein
MLTGFTFSDFSAAAASFNLLGSSTIESDRLQLTPALGGQRGAAWYTTAKQYVAEGFSTTFQFQLAKNVGTPVGGSDGFTFAIQNTDPSFLGGGGGGLAYSGLKNSLVVEFDTFRNSEGADPSESHISVHTGGTGPNNAAESFSLGSFSTNPILDNAAIRTAKIEYNWGALSVYLDDLTTPVLSVGVDLASTLELDYGDAWLGFTAATGGGYQTHDILNWTVETPVAPTTRISVADLSQDEGISGKTDFVFTVTRGGNASSTSTVDWTTADESATAGSDYAAASGSITFGPSETTKKITIAVKGDTIDEPSETFTVNLSNVVGATIADGQGVGTIRDSNSTGPAITISDVTITEGNNPQAALTVEASFAAAVAITVDYSTADNTAVSGLDYVATFGSLTFEPGQVRRTILVPIVDDAAWEPTENFTVSLSNAVRASIADGQAIGTIQDNDPTGPTISIGDVVVSEGVDSQAIFTVRLNTTIAAPVSVNYTTTDGTALAGINYVATAGTLTFAAGETQRTITVPILNDGTTYPTETFTINLSNGTGAVIGDGQGVGTIEDEDFSDLTVTLRVSANGQMLETYLGNPVSPGEDPVHAWPMNSQLPLEIETDLLEGLESPDAVFIELPAGSTGPSGGIVLDTGLGVNRLHVRSGRVRIDSVSTGGVLNTTVDAGAELVTEQLQQNGLTVNDNGRVTLLAGGETSRLNSLSLDAGATLDIADNALVLDYTGTSPAASVREKILSGRGGVGFGASWNGAGINSSAAAQANAIEPELRSIGYADNATLPLGPYTTYRGQPVDETSILIAYTRTGDANLDGLVNDDDVTIVGASYAPGVPQASWALGDFDFNGFVDDDDVTLLGAFYNPAAAIGQTPPASAVARSPDRATRQTEGLQIARQ